MVELRVCKFARAREIEFGRDLNGRSIWDKARVGVVIFFGRKLQDRIPRPWQVAHEIRVNPKPGGHGLQTDILEFERGQKVRTLERVSDPHREGEREIEIREIPRIEITLERMANFLDAPRPVANIAVLRATVRCGGSQLIFVPTKLEPRIPNPIRERGERETRTGTRFFGRQRLWHGWPHDRLPNPIQHRAQAVNAGTNFWHNLEFPNVVLERDQIHIGVHAFASSNRNHSS